jgi:F-type H+-transporting ATPase subunit gamma
MPSIKDYNVKLVSLKNTQKITKTMKMVSASKLRRAQEAQRNARLYAVRLNELISRLSASVESAAHPLLKQHASAKKALVLMFTSNRGLCGGFNNNMCKFVDNWINERRNDFETIDLSFCGRRGYNYFAKRRPARTHYEDVTERPNFEVASNIGDDLSNLFVSGEYDEVYLANNIFKSALSQLPAIQKLLPIEPSEIEGGRAISPDYILEPQEQELLTMLLPRSIYFKIYYALLENSAGEHGARMTAMDNATNNASDLIDSYTLLRNRARQAAITTELTEIVSGAEAL